MTHYQNKFFNIHRDSVNYTKQDFFNLLSNKYGFNIELSHNYLMSDGTIGFSKWKSWLWLLQYNPNEYVDDLFMTRNEFIEKSTHRSILDIEIVFDIDEKGDYISIEENAKHVCIELKTLNKPFVCYSTGSKGFHIHTFCGSLRDLSSTERFEFKKKLMIFLKTDSLKCGNRSMIAIEGEPHWKSGKIKKEVDLL